MPYASLKNAKRIAIIGNAGSGKSVLAQKLHTILKLPVYHLDQYFWKPGWVEPDRSEYEKVHNALCDKHEWIIDGMNLRYLDYRAHKADVLIFLDLPRFRCLWNTFKRTCAYYGIETPSSAKGCVERFNGEYIRFIKWVWNFKKKYPALIKEILNRYPNNKLYVMTSHAEVEEFLDSLKREYDKKL